MSKPAAETVRNLTSEIRYGDHDANAKITATYIITHSISSLFMTLQNIVFNFLAFL